MTVQRLSAHVSGKAQKYARMGPREFVPFSEKLEFNIENIKRACLKHFAPTVGNDVVCDILAGEQGPSCKCHNQIPDVKVIHVRFLPDTSALLSDVNNAAGAKKRKATGSPSIISAFSVNDWETETPKPSTASPLEIKSSPTKFRKPSEDTGSAAGFSFQSKHIPKSLSISDMIKLGKLNKSTATTLVKLYQFNMEMLSWSKIHTEVEFMVEKHPIGSGGFRKAFKAMSKHKDFAGTTWVIKYYLPEALKCIADTGQKVGDHNRKLVQMHLLARNFALQLEDQVTKSDAADEFGDFLSYRKIFHGETDGGKYVAVEEFIPGCFTKYINNTGLSSITTESSNDSANIIGLNAECLVHFSYQKSGKQLMVVDIQGNGYDLFDPEIASTELVDKDMNYLYCTGNLSEVAISAFVNQHKCNRYCVLAGLVPLNT